MNKNNLKTNKWVLNNPAFEFTKELPIESSAWSGHYFFVYDLVANTKPNIIVELGTHKGNSLFSFAQAIKDLKIKTELHAIDTWEGDEHAGFYGEEIYQDFIKIKEKYYKEVKIIPHKMFFDEALKKFKDNSIDILHIDGLHTYEAVKHDFENWLPKVNKKKGIILLHDVCEKTDDFGVYKFWEELKEKYKTITFEHYHGLGVIFLNKSPYYKGSSSSEVLKECYKTISEVQDLNKIISDKDTHIHNLERQTLEHLKEAKKLTKQNQKLTGQNIELINQNKEIKESLSNKNTELQKVYKSRSWRLTKPLRKLFKNLRRLINKQNEI